MRVYGIFHGGCCYNTNWTADDVEQFWSMTEAKETFRFRTDNQDQRFPCTDETAEMWVFTTDPSLDSRVKVGETVLICNLSPDALITRGPKGGVMVTPQ